MNYSFRDFRIRSRRVSLTFCWVSVFLCILIVNISWMGVQTPINRIIFWKSAMKTFRCIYASFFNRLKFLTEVSTELQKMYFLGQFKDHNSSRKHKKLDEGPHFFHLISAFIFLFENIQNLFSCGPLFSPFWSVKYLNFWQRPPIRTTHHTFLEHKHPEVINIMFWPPRGAKKKKKNQLMDYRKRFSSLCWQANLQLWQRVLKPLFLPTVSDIIYITNKNFGFCNTDLCVLSLSR